MVAFSVQSASAKWKINIYPASVHVYGASIHLPNPFEPPSMVFSTRHRARGETFRGENSDCDFGSVWDLNKEKKRARIAAASRERVPETQRTTFDELVQQRGGCTDTWTRLYPAQCPGGGEAGAGVSAILAGRDVAVAMHLGARHADHGPRE
jgi:hypothetical protein